MPPDLPLPTPAPRERPPGRLLGRLAIGFVFLALGLLVVVPLAVQARVEAVRSRLEHVTNPAHTQVVRVQFALTSEADALRRYRATGEEGALRSYDEAREIEIQALDSLQRFAREMGPAVLEPFVRLRTLAAAWNARVADPARALEADAEERTLLEQAIEAAREVDDAIASEAVRSRDQIARTQRFGLVVTLALGALALLAAVTVAWLYRRLRGLTFLAERRRADAERALAASARAMEARARLLRGVTHDVKNPLGAAHGYAELLEMGVKGPLTPDQVRYVAGIRRSIDGALAIIADLLDLARADGGALRVERISVDLAQVTAEALDEHRTAAEAAGHTIDFPAKPEPVPTYTDPDRVRQVLGNLLSNAIKYTPAPGRITVRADLVEGDPAHPGRWAAVRVADTGPGIPAEHREAVFEEFHRLHDGTGVPGHGLGLAIARRVAELLSGQLTLEEGVENGSVFTLWLPLRGDEAAAGK